MVVPNLAVDIKLNETDSALYQAPGHDAAARVRVSRLLPDTIHLQRLFAFLIDVECVSDAHLKVRGQLVTTDAP